MTLCQYCLIKNLGRSVRFTDWTQYEGHVLRNHPGYTVMAYPSELEQFRKSLPFSGSYYKKLQHKMNVDLYSHDSQKYHTRYSLKVMEANRRLNHSPQKVQEFVETRPEDVIRI